MTIHRFHVPSVGPGVVELPEAARNHVTRVLRLKVGDALHAFDGGVEFAATISAIEKRRVLIDVGSSVPSLPERAVRLRLIMSPLKGDLTELVIQKAAELGVARISPAVFERTDTVARREPGENRLQRWHRVATSAAEQSGRSSVPHIDHVVSLKEVIEDIGAASDAEMRIVAAEPSLESPAPAIESRAATRSVLIAVGPAGGLTPGDLEILRGAAFVPQRLALHTLRSETACIAAIAILGDRFR